MKKYLSCEDMEKKLELSLGVGDFAYKFANKIKERNPEQDLDPKLADFLGYVHDIGQTAERYTHELQTIDLLVKKENIPLHIARKAMHGQFAEQYGEKEGNLGRYLPKGIERMILTYFDMSVNTGKPISVDERADEIVQRVSTHREIPAEKKRERERET